MTVNVGRVRGRVKFTQRLFASVKVVRECWVGERVEKLGVM
jgi:hypothetical protein